MKVGKLNPQGAVNYDTWEKIYEHEISSADTEANLLATFQGADGATSGNADTGQVMTFAGNDDITSGQTYNGSSRYNTTMSWEKCFNNAWASDNDGWSSASISTNQWVSCQFSSGKTIAKMTVRNGAPQSANRGMKYAKIEGSNNGSTWTKVPVASYGTNVVAYNTDELELPNTLAALVSDFTLDNSTSYTYYRLYGATNWGDGIMAVAEIEMIEMVSWIDTSQSKIGASSLSLDGSTGYVTLPDSTDWTFGTGDWTIDGWFKFNDFSVNQSLYGHSLNAANRFELTASTTVGLNFYCSLGTAPNPSWAWTPTVGQWYHIATIRKGQYLYMYVDGVKLGEQRDLGAGYDFGDIATPFTIGSLVPYYSGGNYFNGYVDAFRITKGEALWL